MLDPEFGELDEHAIQVEGAVRPDKGPRVGGDAFLDAAGQYTDDDFPVDRVGDPDRRRGGDQTQVAQVGEVVVVGLDRQDVAGEYRPEDLLDPGFGEPGGEGVQMGGPRQDQPFLRLFDMLGGDRLGHRNRDLLDDLPSQGVDQPRLARGQGDRPLDGVRRERLPGVGRMLAVQGTHLVGSEVTQPQRLHLDIERARRSQPRRIAPRGDLIVTNVAQAAQGDRSREIVRPASIAVTKLAEHADQRLPPQRVDLVDEQHQRPRTALRPRPQPGREQRSVRHHRPGGRPKIGGQRVVGGSPDLVEDRAARRTDVVAPRPPGLAGHQERRVPAGCRQLVGKCLQRGRLPRLPGRVDDKVAVLIDQRGSVRQPRHRWDHVVDPRPARAGGVEPSAHRRSRSSSSQIGCVPLATLRQTSSPDVPPRRNSWLTGLVRGSGRSSAVTSAVRSRFLAGKAPNRWPVVAVALGSCNDAVPDATNRLRQ